MNFLSQQHNNTLPPNYDELRKAVNRTANWKERLAAVEELSKWKHKQTIDILTHRLNNDPVYKVQEAAFEALQDFGLEVEMPERKKFDLIKDTSKTFVRLKKSLPKDHTFEDFKVKLQKTRVDIYDTYKGDKGADFDQWLEDQWKAIPSKYSRK
ncbi:HEAT repeat domain-containing protein [Planococcus shenhongbingii]|uniref:HEAT repeat domain-containing protein n=1 Tax=Planococcus shenhongbingii TaxID=3058398 RepID=A0ABT8NFN2_9BACL|nr:MULTISPECIES: HEAT repeat domain-containing protein [unclassified Planococcus (in: firmicutes)]MDN7246514.1 HEAT repeat domain-containing protein [Planococcus sp. N017]WKA59500.1 HEAT repeat domain-containing protein [Planococcus sp. N016]